MNSGELNDVEYFGGSEELIAYSGFRTALGYLQVGDIAMASNAIERTIAGYPDSLHGRAAVEFQNATGLTAAGTSGSISDGCSAVKTFLEENLDRFHEVWSYGYANPAPSTQAICPF